MIHKTYEKLKNKRGKKRNFSLFTSKLHYATTASLPYFFPSMITALRAILMGRKEVGVALERTFATFRAYPSFIGRVLRYRCSMLHGRYKGWGKSSNRTQQDENCKNF
jgi:hypothetical protein